MSLGGGEGTGVRHASSGSRAVGRNWGIQFQVYTRCIQICKMFSVQNGPNFCNSFKAADGKPIYQMLVEFFFYWLDFPFLLETGCNKVKEQTYSTTKKDMQRIGTQLDGLHKRPGHHHSAQSGQTCLWLCSGALPNPIETSVARQRFPINTQS